MKVVYSKKLDNVLSKLVLDEKTSYLYIFYNGICISEITDNTWNNIRDCEDWVYSAIISFAVDVYKKKQEGYSSDFYDALAELD